MRVFQTPFGRRFLILLTVIASALLSPNPLRADEISFGETYVEKLVATDVVWSGTTELKITLPWNGFDITSIDGNTELSFSVGDFQFDRILDAADIFVEGNHSARFTDSDFDNNGNPASILLVDVTWNTTAFTIVATLQNFSEASDANFIGALAHLDIAGSFKDTNSFAIAFGGFGTNYPVPVSGKTTLTRKVVGEETLYLNNVELSGSANLPPSDTKAPTVRITTPSANGRLLTNVITGKASDNVGVAEVLYRIGDGQFTLADGTTSWSATVALSPGTNVVQVKSIDLAGNESPVLTNILFYVVTGPLAVEFIPDRGSTTLTNGQLLELGKNYFITAKPTPGYKFQDWTGDVNSQEAKLSFMMSSNFLLQANFVTNPFIPIKGVYSGLLSDTNGVTPGSSGFFTATLAESGAFSGKLLLGGVKYSVSGQFGLSGVADQTIVTGPDSVILHLNIGFDGSLSGTLTTNKINLTNEVNSRLEAELVQTTTNAASTKYTLLIPPAIDPATAPGGYGFGSASVDTKGNLRFSGTLSDGTHVSQSAVVSATGRWPLYASLYHGQGVLLGWLSFTNEPDNDLRGDVTWTKLPGTKGKFYTNGFTNAGPSIGSLYVVPPQGATALNTTNPISGSLEFTGGNLTVPLTNTFLWNTNNKLTVTSTNKTTLTANRSSGLLSGKFVHPDTLKITSFKGTILQKPMWGGGFFLGTNQSGAFLLQPTPDLPN